MYRTKLHVYKGTLEKYRTKREIKTNQTSKKKEKKEKPKEKKSTTSTAATEKTKLVQADNHYYFQDYCYY